MKFKPWEFGKRAKALPVIEDLAHWKSSTVLLNHEIEPGVIERRTPSRMVPETLAAIIENPRRFLVRSRKAWDIHKISRLQAGEVYRVPATRELVLEDCWVHLPSGMVISSQRQVLSPTSHAPACFYQGHSDVDWEEAPQIEGESFLLATVWGENFAHWLMDSLPRLALGPTEKLLMGKSVPRFQSESLALLGYEADRLVIPSTSLVRCRKLRVYLAARTSGIPHPACLDKVRRQLQAGFGPSEGTTRRLYISRQKTRRRIINHEEVLPVLKEFGFEEIFCEEMRFPEQVGLFSSAEAIFGAHGAGTMNVLFSPPGAALIEAFNPQVWDHSAHRVASLGGARHFHLFAENASKDYDIRIDPKLLARTLALALEKEPPDPRLIETSF